MSYGDMKLSRTINEMTYFYWGIVILLCYSAIILDYELFSFVFFIPHLLFVGLWFFIGYYNEIQDYKNTVVIAEQLTAHYYYVKARLEAMKL